MSTSPCQFNNALNNTQTNIQTDNFNINAAGLTIFRGLLRHDFVRALAANNAAEVDWLLSLYLMQHPGQTMTPADMLLELLLGEENLFAATAAHTGSVPAGLLATAADEIAVMQAWLAAHPNPAWLSDTTENATGPIPARVSSQIQSPIQATNPAQISAQTQAQNNRTSSDIKPADLTDRHTLPPTETANRPASFQAACGCEQLSLHCVRCGDDTLHPVTNPDPVNPSDLTGCDHQKDNRTFSDIKPANLTDWHTLPPTEAADRLASFHAACGYGQLSLHRVWRWDGTLHPVTNPDPVRLSDLVGCDHQKEILMQNTRFFVEQRRGNNLLLYGARGTGKSSMVKAISNELAAEGLCLLELTVDHITDLPEIINLLHGQPRPYIIFIDDLSFETAGQSYKTTKAVLEGSVTALGSNTLIYATSNRRHLIVENWHDRDGAEHQNGEVRASDSMSEKFSLADRFGQTILFTTPNQNEYLSIVSALAAASGIALPPSALHAKALKWALWQNGYSGRTARQFINSLPQK